MDFQLTRSQIEIQKAARDFARGEFDKEILLELESRSLFPESIWKKACELGFVGINFDEKFSGSGLGIFENILLAEALCSKDSSAGAALMSAAHASGILLKFGSGAQKEKFLPKVAEGQMLSAGAFRESQTGYGVDSISSTANEDQGRWIINGEKVGVTNGGEAGFYLVLCLTDPDADLSNSMSIFIVERDRAGITVTDSGRKLGCCMVKSADLKLENVEIPLANLVGKRGDGFTQMEHFINEQMIISAGIALGTAQGALDRAIPYVKEREQFGRKIALFEVLQHKIANMAIKVELARLVTYRTAFNFDKGRINKAEAGMALQVAASAAETVSDEALQLHGGYGYMKEYEVEHFYRDAKFTGIHESNQALRLGFIAKQVIGKIKG